MRCHRVASLQIAIIAQHSTAQHIATQRTQALAHRPLVDHRVRFMVAAGRAQADDAQPPGGDARVKGEGEARGGHVGKGAQSDPFKGGAVPPLDGSLHHGCTS